MEGDGDFGGHVSDTYIFSCNGVVKTSVVVVPIVRLVEIDRCHLPVRLKSGLTTLKRRVNDDKLAWKTRDSAVV